MHPNCKDLDECTEENINNYILTGDKLEAIIEQIISESIYEDFISCKKGKGYSNQSYKYRNKGYINGERAHIVVNKKKSAKEYWYYYIYYEEQRFM